jgi:RND family efflux transporter MFP subunit
MKTKIVWGVGAALVGVGAFAAASRLGSPVAEVSAGPVHETVIAQGSVVATQGVAHVRARTEGRITRVLVREGDEVTAGQLLGEIDSAEARAQLSRVQAERRALGAEAALKAAQTTLAQAEDHHKRTRHLRAMEAVSEQAALDAERAVDVARAQVAEARARRDGTAASVEEAERHLDRTRLYAPAGGVVLARHVDEGDTVSPASGSLFEIADAGRTEVAVEIEEPDAMRVQLGLKVTLTGPGGRPEIARGTLTRLSPRLGKRTVGADDARLRAEHLVRTAWVQWTGPALPIGKRLEAAIHLPPHDVAARVPRAAVVVKDGRAVVDTGGWIGGEKPVTLGAADEAFVEVEGLAVGTPVKVPRP